MAPMWNAPIFAIATVYFAADALFSAATGPITRWLSKKRLLERVRRWVTSLGPYQSFALFAVPVVILEPAKPLSAYLIGTGHLLPGDNTVITCPMAGKHISVTYVAGSSTKLMSNGAQHIAVAPAAFLCNEHNTTLRGPYDDRLSQLRVLVDELTGCDHDLSAIRQHGNL
jgi:hypothetical protein